MSELARLGNLARHVDAIWITPEAAEWRSRELARSGRQGSKSAAQWADVLADGRAMLAGKSIRVHRVVDGGTTWAEKMGWRDGP